MNTSLIRTIGSPVLIAAFLVAPISPALSQANFTTPIKVTVAEAAAISYGSIGGVIALTDSVASKLSEGTNVKIYLNDSKALVSTLVTDKNGSFSFTGVQGLTYKVEIKPAIGFGVPTSASSTVVVALDKNNISLNSFVVEKLPAVKMFGGDTIVLQVGDKFEDPGVVFAKEDGTVVSGYGIDGLGKVDTTIPGKYIITYHVDDKATNGYPTIDATRTVNVIPKIIAIAPIAKKSGLTVLPTVNTKVYINSYLGKSFSNDKLEVLKLQAFLFFKEGNMNVKATGVYDDATEKAVRNFQDKYYKEVLMPWGTDDNTGEVRMTTLKKINDLYNGVSTRFTLEQELAIESTRTQDEINRNTIAKVEEVPFVVSVDEKKSIGSKISSWWNNAKRSLVAAFPSFKKSEKELDEVVATGTILNVVEKAEVKEIKEVEKVEEKVVNKVEGDDNLAAAKTAKGGAIPKALIFFSTIFALLAFVVAIYIFRKTRGPVLVTVEEEIEEAIEAIEIPVKK
jgi:hypothetical protein